MPTNTLNHTSFQRIQELRPKQRSTQLRNFVWLLTGILESRSECMSRIAGKIPGSAKLLSATRRLSQLPDKPAIWVWECHEPSGRQWLEAQFRNLGERRLIVARIKLHIELFYTQHTNRISVSRNCWGKEGRRDSVIEAG